VLFARYALRFLFHSTWNLRGQASKATSGVLIWGDALGLPLSLARALALSGPLMAASTLVRLPVSRAPVRRAVATAAEDAVAGGGFSSADSRWPFAQRVRGCVLKEAEVPGQFPVCFVVEILSPSVLVLGLMGLLLLADADLD